MKLIISEISKNGECIANIRDTEYDDHWSFNTHVYLFYDSSTDKFEITSTSWKIGDDFWIKYLEKQKISNDDLKNLYCKALLDYKNNHCKQIFESAKNKYETQTTLADKLFMRL